MGQRSSTETVAAIYQAFLTRRTWRQPELAKEVGVGVEALRRVLFELAEKGMPLERDEEDRSKVYWSVPADWFPEAVLFKREEVPELLASFGAFRRGPAASAFWTSCLHAFLARRSLTTRSSLRQRDLRRRSFSTSSNSQRATALRSRCGTTRRAAET